MNNKECGVRSAECGIIVFLLLTIAGGSTAADLSNSDVAVEAGQEAFESQWGLPWYDAEADDYKPLHLPPPKDSDWNWDWLESIFNFFSGWGSGFSTIIKVLAWIALAALVAWLLYLLIKGIEQVELKSADAVDEAEDGRSDIQRVEALPMPVERHVTDFLAEARRLHAAGDHSLAVVYLFSHQLIVLDRHRLIRLQKGKTNRQYLRELRRNMGPFPQLTRIVQPTMLLFEEAFFGAHPPSADQLNALLAASEDLESSAEIAGAAT